MVGTTSGRSEIPRQAPFPNSPLMTSDPNVYRTELRIWVHSGVDMGVNQCGHKAFQWVSEPVWLLQRFSSPRDQGQAKFWTSGLLETAGGCCSLGHFRPEMRPHGQVSLELQDWGNSLRSRSGFNLLWISSAPDWVLWNNGHWAFG